MADLEALNTQLTRVNAKMEQAARIFSELRARKQAVLAGATKFPLQDILSREQRVIEICTEGLATVKLALSEIKKAAVPLKPTKKFRNLWDTLDANLHVARDFLDTLSSDQALWRQWQVASEPEKKIILKKLAQNDKDMKDSLQILSGVKKIIMTEEFMRTLPMKIDAAVTTAITALFLGSTSSEPDIQGFVGLIAAALMGVTWAFYKMSLLKSDW